MELFVIIVTSLTDVAAVLDPPLEFISRIGALVLAALAHSLQEFHNISCSTNHIKRSLKKLAVATIKTIPMIFFRNLDMIDLLK